MLSISSTPLSTAFKNRQRHPHFSEDDGEGSARYLLPIPTNSHRRVRRCKPGKGRWKNTGRERGGANERSCRNMPGSMHRTALLCATRCSLDNIRQGLSSQPGKPRGGGERSLPDVEGKRGIEGTGEERGGKGLGNRHTKGDTRVFSLQNRSEGTETFERNGAFFMFF